MDFSVVVPTHKRLKKLQELLKSLNAQSYDKNLFEVIIIATEKDEAFQLNNLEINFDFSWRLEFVPNDPHHGKSASVKRNYGAHLSQANWIAFIDDDCIADKDWLKNAKKLTAEPKTLAIEGHTHIPKPSKPTFTYKGMKRLSNPQGYQTCNMFYRKDVFQSVGGFDPAFPFYLEDTDLAWTVLESKGPIHYSKDVVVEHPVPSPEPKRLLSSALRMSKIPYLYKKHPITFKKSGMRAYPRPYIFFLILDIITLGSLLTGLAHWPPVVYSLRLLLTLVYLFRMYRKCHFQWSEIAAVFGYTLICPLIGIFQLLKGNIQQRTFLFYGK